MTAAQTGHGRALLVAVLALVLVAGCGVRVNDGALAGPNAHSSTTKPSDRSPTSTSRPPRITTTTSPVDETSTTAGTTTTSSDMTPSTLDPSFRDGLVKGFVDAGLTEQQANCLADGYSSLGLTDPSSAANFDPSKFVDLFDQCGVSPSQFGRGTVPPGD